MLSSTSGSGRRASQQVLSPRSFSRRACLAVQTEVLCFACVSTMALEALPGLCRLRMPRKPPARIAFPSAGSGTVSFPLALCVSTDLGDPVRLSDTAPLERASDRS